MTLLLLAIVAIAMGYLIGAFFIRRRAWQNKLVAETFAAQAMLA